ncbi:MAG: hypothetical protein Q8K75_02565 [Chlamydiales bacterium]|nr:hypothetical protein [Chlamydiales bacterium]
MKYLLSIILLVVGTSCFANTTHREYQFENDSVKVWKTIIYPNSPLKFHRHDYPRVIVGLVGGVLTRIEESGEVSYLNIETGKAYWYEADEPGLHWDMNESDAPIEVMLIEVRK